MLTLKRKVTPDVFNSLDQLIHGPGNPFKVTRKTLTKSRTYEATFVRLLPGDMKFDGNTLEIRIEITDEVPDGEDPIPLEKIEPLFKIFGIFPRLSETAPIEEAHLKIIDVYQTLTELSHRLSPTGDEREASQLVGSIRTDLERVEKHLKALLSTNRVK